MSDNLKGRRRKKPSELVRVELPNDIGVAGFRAASSRTEPFVKRWASLQAFEGAMTVHDLVRQVYLQGIWDGVQLVWSGHLPKDEDAMQSPGALIEFINEGSD